MKISIFKAILMAMVFYCGVASAGDSTSSFINPLPGASSVLASTCDGTMLNIKYTTTQYQGNFGGVSAANTICGAAFPGYHFCSWTEMSAKSLTGCLPPTNTFYANDVWVTAPGYTSSANTCANWTSTAEPPYSNNRGTTITAGANWSLAIGVAYCGNGNPIACCK